MRHAAPEGKIRDIMVALSRFLIPRRKLLTVVSTAASSEADMVVVLGSTAVEEEDFVLGSRKEGGSIVSILHQRTRNEDDSYGRLSSEKMELHVSFGLRLDQASRRSHNLWIVQINSMQ